MPLAINGRTLEGNCDLCFLKPRGQRIALIKASQKATDWWVCMEVNLASKPGGARFHAASPSYTDLARFVTGKEIYSVPQASPFTAIAANDEYVCWQLLIPLAQKKPC